MKRVVFLLLFGLLIWNVSGADLELANGRKYCNVEVQRVLAGCVVIVHDAGKTTLELNDLPDSFIAALSSRQRMGLQDLVDLQLKDGKVYKKTSIVDLGAGKVVLSYLGGTITVAVKDLPEKYLATFTRSQLRKLKERPVNKQKKDDPNTPAPAVERRADGKVIHTGIRGGKYYINKSGRRVYLPKKEADAE